MSEPVIPAPGALVERPWIDLVVLGGMNVFLMPLLTFAPSGTTPLAEDARIALIILVNYPHFIASYGRAYARPRAFIFGHWPQLLLVPLLLLLMLLVCWFAWHRPLVDVPGAGVVDALLTAVGARARLSAYQHLGPGLLWLLVQLMLLSVGWHYAKQCFGVTLVLARYRGVPVAPDVRVAFRRLLLAIWCLQWLTSSSVGGSAPHLGFGVLNLSLPPAFSIAGLVLVIVLAAHLARALWGARSAWRSVPLSDQVAIAVPLTALAVWFGVGGFANIISFGALFHSMQYLAFIWRVERTVRQPWQLALGVVALVATGWLVFQGLPRALEATLSASDATGGAFFLIAVSVFINLPHYFIDNVIWRFDDPQVQERLLAPAAR